MDYSRIKNVDEIEHGVAVAIYGAGESGRSLYDEIRSKRSDVNVICFVDSYKSSGEIFNIPVFNISEIGKINFSIVVIASMYYEEIANHLKSIGVENYCIYRNPAYFTDLYFAAPLVVNDRINFVHRPPVMDINRVYYVFNVGDCDDSEKKALESIGAGVLPCARSFSDRSDYNLKRAFSAYIASDFDQVCLIDVEGYDYQLSALAKFATVDLGRDVILYKKPIVERNFSIIESKKILFLEICKNGTSSTVRILEDIYRKYKCPDDLYGEMRNYSDFTVPYFDGFTKFAVVRNPYDRLASLYAHLMRVGEKEWLNSVFSILLNPYSFANFCRFVAGCPDEFADPHFRSQTSFLTAPEGFMSDVTLLRMENYAEDVTNYFASTGEDIEVPHKNKSRPNKVDYITDYYTPELIKLVNERYKDDFINFGYEFL